MGITAKGIAGYKAVFSLMNPFPPEKVDPVPGITVRVQTGIMEFVAHDLLRGRKVWHEPGPGTPDIPESLHP